MQAFWKTKQPAFMKLKLYMCQLKGEDQEGSRAFFAAAQCTTHSYACTHLKGLSQRFPGRGCFWGGICKCGGRVGTTKSSSTDFTALELANQMLSPPLICWCINLPHSPGRKRAMKWKRECGGEENVVLECLSLILLSYPLLSSPFSSRILGIRREGSGRGNHL